jgi:hypothetical protein
MDSDDLRADISAVEQEIAGAASRHHKPGRQLPVRLLVVALVIFIAVDWLIHHKPHSKAEDDLNHMMQQARHTVVDYQHRYGQLPAVVPNAALRPYVALVKLGGDQFRLEGKLGDVTQELEGP